MSGKYISYEKLSKKQRRQIDSKRRVMWSDFGVESPQTKVMENKKAYSRPKSKAAAARWE